VITEKKATRRSLERSVQRHRSETAAILGITSGYYYLGLIIQIALYVELGINRYYYLGLIIQIALYVELGINRYYYLGLII